MKGYVKFVLYIFAGYNFIVGIIAVIMPSLVASIYSVDSISPEFSMASRWLGALAIAMAYGALVIVKKPNKEIARILIIGAYATMIASVLGIFSGEVAASNIWFDFVLQAALVVALTMSGKDYGMLA